MNNMEFIKGEDSILLKDNQPEAVSYTIVVEEAPDSFLVEIPSFKIFFETDSEDKIDDLTKKSFESFFNYWLVGSGLDVFTKHLLSLGFKRKHSPSKLKVARQNLVFGG